MKKLFIQAKLKKDVMPIIEKALPELSGKKIAIVTTIQHFHQMDKVKERLEKEGYDVVECSQILGCFVPRTQADCFLYVGSGYFHPKSVLLNYDKVKVVCADPIYEKIIVLTEKDIEKLMKKIKGAKLKFLSSENIGVIISLKEGQNKYKMGRALERKYPDKNFYFFVCDVLNFQELENFPFVDCYVNSMCPRIGYDDTIRLEKPLVDIEEVI